MSDDGPSKPSAPLYPIGSVDNALRLLLEFREKPEIRLSQAADLLGVANSTAHRLLAMLAYHGFVRQDPGSKAYVAGPALADVGLSVVRRMNIREVARPILEEVVEELEETVHLAILEGSVVRYIDAVEGPRTLRVTARIGRTLPAHCTSVGKALLAQLPVEEVMRIYPSEALPTTTAMSLSDRDELVSALEDVRRLGYALNTEESEEGVAAVAVAIKGGGAPVAAISCAAPVSRMGPRRSPLVYEALRTAAARIARRMPG